MTTHRPTLAPLLALLLALAACSGPAGQGEGGGEASGSDAEREAILARIDAYLPVLARAYASGDIESLRPYAVERVMAQVEKRVTDLAAAGMVLEAELGDVVLEEAQVWGNGFAMVRTLETWDLRHYSTGGHTLVSERLGTRNRVQYQLKTIDGEWMIFHRALEQEFDEAP